MAVLSSDALSSVAYATDQTLAVLILAMLASGSHLPRLMAFRGDRLVFQNGILVLIALAGLIIVFCKGDTTMAINLYAVGVFLAFTISQSGMVICWLRQRGSAWRWRELMNGFGALFTGLVLAVVVFSKFSGGAWLVLLLIPSLVWIVALIKKRYGRLHHALDLDESDEVIKPVLPLHSEVSIAPADPGQRPIVVCLKAFDRAAIAAVRQACSVSRKVSMLSIYSSHHDPNRFGPTGIGRSANCWEWP